MKLLVMQFSSTSRRLTSLWSKYSPQHPVLKRPQFMYFPYCQRPCFTPIRLSQTLRIIADLSVMLRNSNIWEGE
jgi:hypothetical protein